MIRQWAPPATAAELRPTGLGGSADCVCPWSVLAAAGGVLQRHILLVRQLAPPAAAVGLLPTGLGGSAGRLRP